MPEAKGLMPLSVSADSFDVLFSDHCAFSMIEALKKLHSRIPEDISDSPGREVIAPPLTTVRCEHFETAGRAAELMLPADKWYAPGQLLIETVEHKVIVRNFVKQAGEQTK